MSATLSRRAYLGAVLPDDATAFSPRGMLIDDVLAGSMAEQAGLRHGDHDPQDEVESEGGGPSPLAERERAGEPEDERSEGQPEGDPSEAC